MSVDWLIVEMVLSKYGPNPLRRCYGALIGMMVRAAKMQALPAGCSAFEKMPDDFWTR